MGPFLPIALLFALLYPGMCKECPFPYTNQTLSDCEFSRWLSWNCNCCGSDVITHPLAKRQRGICCAKGEAVQDCLIRCGYNHTDDTEYDVCGDKCPNKNSMPTNCVYDKTTTTTTTPSPPTIKTTGFSLPVGPGSTFGGGDPQSILPANSVTNDSLVPGTGHTPSLITSTVNSTAIHKTKSTLPILIGLVLACAGVAFISTCLLIAVCKKNNNRSRVMPRTEYPHGTEKVLVYDDPNLYYNFSRC